MPDLSKLKFIIPDWDDIVDPGFDFVNEKNSENYKKDKYVYGARIWNIYEDPPLDGVLISRSVIDPPNSKKKKRLKLRKIEERGLRDFLKIPEDLRDRSRFQIIGDCGAWQYIELKYPPYDPIETLEFYNRLGFDYGVSVDHIAVGPDAVDRVRITYENAKKSFVVWKKKYESGEYSFILLGSVQGTSIEEYLRGLEKLYDLGYRSFALGGLAKKTTQFVNRFINKLIEFTRGRRDIEKIHFLGIARPTTIKLLLQLTDYIGEVSFDNATFLRGAWTRSFGNYLTLDGKLYTSIRVRIGSPMEDLVLDTLRKYDRGEISYEEIISIVKEYVSRIGDVKYLPYYAKTLKDMPWKECSCNICRRHGIEVIIFRRNDRNRRRGFHNIWVFYNLLKKGQLPDKLVIVKGDHGEQFSLDMSMRFKVFEGLEIDPSKPVLIITHCTQEKSVDWFKIKKLLDKHGLSIPGFDVENEDQYRKVLRFYIKPAHKMYGGMFKYIKQLARVLRKLGIQVDIVIISARYGVIREKDPIIPYEATLNALSLREIKKWSKKHDLSNKLLSIINGRDYSLIIVILPKKYLYAARDVVEKLLDKDNVVIISSIKMKPSRALVIHANNMRKRIEAITLLKDYFIYKLVKYSQKTLDEFFNR